MKNLLFLFVLLLSTTSFSQDQSYFAQCYFDISNIDSLKTLEAEIRLNPNIKIARLDVPSQRAFIITKDISEFTISDLQNLFSDYSETISCVQIGRYGIDPIAKYPFKNCD